SPTALPAAAAASTAAAHPTAGTHRRRRRPRLRGCEGMRRCSPLYPRADAESGCRDPSFRTADDYSFVLNNQWRAAGFSPTMSTPRPFSPRSRRSLNDVRETYFALAIDVGSSRVTAATARVNRDAPETPALFSLGASEHS